MAKKRSFTAKRNKGKTKEVLFHNLTDGKGPKVVKQAQGVLIVFQIIISIIKSIAKLFSKKRKVADSNSGVVNSLKEPNKQIKNLLNTDQGQKNNLEVEQKKTAFSSVEIKEKKTTIRQPLKQEIGEEEKQRKEEKKLQPKSTEVLINKFIESNKESLIYGEEIRIMSHEFRKLGTRQKKKPYGNLKNYLFFHKEKDFGVMLFDGIYTLMGFMRTRYSVSPLEISKLFLDDNVKARTLGSKVFTKETDSEDEFLEAVFKLNADVLAEEYLNSLD